MDLNSKSLDELKEIANNLNIKFHPHSKEKSLIDKIEKQQGHRVEAAKDKVEKAKEQPKQAHDNTPDDVLKAIQPILDQKPAFRVSFGDDGTWLFSYNGAEDSGNLKIPLRVIKQKAMIVARGRYVLRALERAKGDNTYAGNVLSAK